MNILDKVRAIVHIARQHEVNVRIRMGLIINGADTDEIRGA